MTANLLYFLIMKAYPHRYFQIAMHVFGWGLPTSLAIYALSKSKSYKQKEVIMYFYDIHSLIELDDIKY